YSTLLRARRIQLHSRITAVLESQFSEIAEMQPEVLARHCEESGQVEKAVRYRLRAGQQAIARWTMPEAVAHVRKGLDLLLKMSNSPAHQELELSLQVALGQALLATKGYAAQEPGEVYERARQLCELLGRPPQLGQILVGQYLFRAVRAELEQAEFH